MRRGSTRQDVAGLTGGPPTLCTYVEVEDGKAAVERVKAHGGVLSDGPFEVPDVGEIAVIQDPTGAHLRIWHSASGHCAEIFNVPAMIWNELRTDRPEDAARFYAAVLGVETETTGPPMNYTTWKVGGRSVAGILKTTPEMGGFPSTWSVYFGSDDVDRTVGLAISAGGTAIREPFDIPQVGRIAVVQDPQGCGLRGISDVDEFGLIGPHRDRREAVAGVSIRKRVRNSAVRSTAPGSVKGSCSPPG